MAKFTDWRLCFVGESFVNGTGDETGLGWAGRLCADLAQKGVAVTYYNLGIRRETSTELLQRWEAECDRRLPPDTDNRVIFSFGTNDTTWENGCTRVDPATSLANARHILSRAQANYTVLMVSPPPIADAEQNARTHQLCQHLAELCRELKIPYLDVFSPLLHSEQWRDWVTEVDGAHPPAVGYAKLAHMIQSWSGWNEWFDSL